MATTSTESNLSDAGVWQSQEWRILKNSRIRSIRSSHAIRVTRIGVSVRSSSSVQGGCADIQMPHWLPVYHLVEHHDPHY
jgi:hypothetical protein